MLTYSIVIRTLGTSGDVFREELLSIARQTVEPEQLLVYIAEGYSRPQFTVGREEYIWVKKGMMAQRLLSYDNIDSDCILMLDDDVILQPDSAEKLLNALETHSVDCVGADTFKNHEMSVGMKIYAAVTNLVFPHADDGWAFKIRRNGSFSYNRRPKGDFVLSQSCGGNAMLWRKSTYGKLHFEDELWLEELAFAYGEDMLESYKVYKNGFRLGVVYNSGIEHINVGSASGLYHNSSDKIKTRTMALLAVWWRTCFRPGGSCFFTQFFTACAFLVKISWLFSGFLTLSLVKFDFSYISNFVKGLSEGWKFVHSKAFTCLPPYVIR